MITPIQPKITTVNPKAAFQSRLQSPKFAAPKADSVALRFGAVKQSESSSAEKSFLNAAKNGNVETLQALLEGPLRKQGKLDIEVYDDKEGRGALHWAVNYNYPNVAEMLIKAGININSQDYGGMTPLNLAVRQGRAEMVDRLLAAGADVNLPDGSKESPLHQAAALSNVSLEILETLLKKGANPNLKNLYGATPLYSVATWSENLDKVKVLLKAGADPMIETNEGNNALESALGFGNHGVAKLILDSEQFAHGKSDQQKFEILKTAVFKVFAGDED